MAVTVKIASREDLDVMLEIEHDTMPNHTYLFETQNELLDPAQGKMLLSYLDDVPVGIAHVYFQPDRAGWFEILRVKPAYQKKGAGTAMWDKALEICEEEKLVSLGMYTGATNVTSKKIAERKGLTLAAQVKEGVLKRDALPKGCSEGFEAVTAEYAAKVMADKTADLSNTFVYNRTFFAFSKGNYKWLENDNMLFAKGETVVSVGARFNKDAALQIGFMAGDLDEAIQFAISKMSEGNWPQLVIDVPDHRTDIIEKLESYGFEFMPNTIITLKRDF